ncbi:MAG: hypothetical protein ABIR80_12840 [Opitutaceae bacterium]
MANQSALSTTIAGLNLAEGSVGAHRSQPLAHLWVRERSGAEIKDPFMGGFDQLVVISLLFRVRFLS